MQVALSMLKDLSAIVPFLDIVTGQTQMIDKLDTVKLQARDHFGRDVALEMEFKQIKKI